MSESLSAAPRLRILIVGGYGIFGGRLVELLADEPRLTLIIAGRSQARADAFCAGLTGKASTLAAAFDRDAPLGAQLAALAPDVVVDATGPFQAYGTQPYRLAEASIEQGAAYLDLADGADFVRGITALGERARRRGVTVLSGVSSFPVLTAAALRHLASDLPLVRILRAGIAPSPHAVVGENVIRAIAGYAGRPVAAIRGGRRAVVHPLTETLRRTIAPPGALALPNTLFSLVEVPDLLLLADIRPEIQEIWIGAGLRPEILHRVLIGLAFLVRWKILPSLAPLAGLMHRANRYLRWGEHRGGMFVEIVGERQDGTTVQRSWHLSAEGDDGPYIPAMAIAALIQKRLEGDPPVSGARPALRELELADYDRLFAGRAFRTGVREEGESAGKSLYERLLGEAFNRLPAPIRALHRLAKPGGLARGRGSVERGRGVFARLTAALVGFPPAAEDVPVEVRFTLTEEGEVWERNFAGRRFRSVQSEGRGAFTYLASERFGPLSFGLSLVVEGERLRLVVRGWRFLGLPLPAFLAPTGETYEHAADGRFNFHVEIAHPLIGLVVRYKGWLEPA